jgi:NitT/TauT family transport system permease protein
MRVSAPLDEPLLNADPPAVQRRARTARRDLIALLVVVVAIFAAMQVSSMFVPAYIMPPLAQTFGALGHALVVDWPSIVMTIVRVLVALACASVCGTALGCLMGMNGRLRPYLNSSLIIDTGIPALSWMLVAVFWFKNPEARIFFVLFMILLPFYAMNVYDGIKALPKDWFEAINVFRPTRRQVLVLLILPHILPYVLMTTKSIVGYATRMVVFAELIGATIGIGAKMGLAEATFKMPDVLAWTLVLVVINIASQAGVGQIEKRLMHWRPEPSIG